MEKNIKKKRRKNKFNKYFLLSWKKLVIIIIVWFLAVILHNLVYGVFKTWFDANGGDEAFFFIIAIFVIPIYFLICLVYSLIFVIKKGSK